MCPGESSHPCPCPSVPAADSYSPDGCLNTYLLRGSFPFTRNTKASLHLGSRMFSNGPWTVYQPCLYPVPTNLKGPPLQPNEPQGTSSTSQQGQPQGMGLTSHGSCPFPSSGPFHTESRVCLWVQPTFPRSTTWHLTELPLLPLITSPNKVNKRRPVFSSTGQADMCKSPQYTPGA